ncbi:hypothetical protein P608_25105 [Comamonas thiooxydans]|uniref:Uncharacterized protein n=1 Tax=Comamonas thiooxydans TaxID=363952 RepID=A0A0E3BQI9_9BURK|nr:hypothetical protein P608_25105 [Comamonas thiooxydans]KGH17477.1 hypothetical protein P607_17015 [Comamonas thiooxydans]KGH18900.1 hypothetical protein P606_24220 [Comamonas thiooxydans]
MIHFISDNVAAYIQLEANLAKSTWSYVMTVVLEG